MRRITMTLGPYDDYVLLWGIEYTGSIVVDDVRILEGLGGVWRRDFSGGVALVNPTGRARTVELGETLVKIAGVQDPLHNDGSRVVAVTVPPYDGYVLLREAARQLIFLSPVLSGGGGLVRR